MSNLRNYKLQKDFLRLFKNLRNGRKRQTLLIKFDEKGLIIFRKKSLFYLVFVTLNGRQANKLLTQGVQFVRLKKASIEAILFGKHISSSVISTEIFT